MEEIIKALHNSDLDQIAELLYGDGAYEVVKALTPEQRKERRDKVMTNVALGTNAVGSVAGPAALGLAWRSARKNEGGTPRAYAPSIARKLQGKNKSRASRVAGYKIQRGVNALNRPSSGTAKAAAGAAGATLVGLQAVNWGGDILSTKLINDQKKKNVQKAYDPNEPKKLTMVRLGSRAAFRAAEKGPAVKVKLTPLPENLKAKVSKAHDIEFRGEISKMDNDKRQVFGWASVVEIDGKPVVDLQGDVMELEEIEKAAYEYVVKSRKGGHQHRRNGDEPVHVSDLVESFLVTPEKKAQLGLPDDMPTGWWVGFQINDDEVWKSVKEGKLPEFSIHGSGVRKDVEVDD